MKHNALKKYLLSLICASSALGGEVVIIETVTITQAPVPEDKLYAELAAFYGFSSSDLLDSTSALGKTDIVGGNMTLGYEFDPHHSLNLRMGYGYGSDSATSNMWREKVKAHTFTFMPGYRYTHRCENNWSYFMGINLGVSNESVKYKASNIDRAFSAHDAEWGFAYSAELGIQYHFSESCYAFFSYKFRGNTAQPSHYNASNDYHLTTQAQSYHTLSLGMGWNF